MSVPGPLPMSHPIRAEPLTGDPELALRHFSPFGALLGALLGDPHAAPIGDPHGALLGDPQA